MEKAGFGKVEEYGLLFYKILAGKLPIIYSIGMSLSSLPWRVK
jgi:hypothetical protein